MSREFVQENHHPAHENIHGVLGCLTADGDICSTCCFFFAVKPLSKSQEVKCQHQSCQGCSIHNQPSQPQMCQDYHCSRELEVLKNPLLADEQLRAVTYGRVVNLLQSALLLEQITPEQFETQVKRWQTVRDTVYSLVLGE